MIQGLVRFQPMPRQYTQGALPCAPLPPQLVQAFQSLSREALANLPLQRWPLGLRPQRLFTDSAL